VNGFGQSPIVVPPETEANCDTDLSGYMFEEGDCMWDQLFFQILHNGVWVGPNRVPGSPNTLAPDVVCTLGRMKIPGDDNWYIANQMHIHSNSEHSVAGSVYDAEVHVVHVREDDPNKFAVFALFVDNLDDYEDNEGGHGSVLAPGDGGGDKNQHTIFDHYLQGWEAVAKQSEEYCASNPSGHGQFTPNRLFNSLQDLVQCPAVGSQVDNVDDLTFVEQTQLLPIGWNNTFNIRVPELERPDYPDGIVPSLYDSLPTYPLLNSGSNKSSSVYTYRGGLTTPPCLESVRWNILSRPMGVSIRQLDRLKRLILCFVERSTCRHATVADHFGGTNRPSRPLHGRKVTHRCPVGDAGNTTTKSSFYYNEEADDGSAGVVMDDPMAPPIEAPFRRRCLDVQSPYQNPAECIPIEEEVWIALVWPALMLFFGVCGYFFLSRYVPTFPTTALMFLFGMATGIIASATSMSNNAYTQSTLLWEDINSELLLMAFLPALLFGDAFNLNVNLIRESWLQCLIMAFPLVLIGTGLTALVGVYILPYDWNGWLALTWGSILAATDPVAVAALLKELGAPPRLKMLIAGESLLNDGSAIVFFTIFSQKWFASLNINGFGYDIDMAQGFAIFFRMSLGAIAIGILMGLILVLILRRLSRRFSHGDSVVQVIAVLAVTYLNYYINDSLVFMSGVMAVVAQGAVVKALGEHFLLGHMFHSFWEVLEAVLNALIFALGGVIFGGVIGNQHPLRVTSFTGGDWGYAILAYILVNVIRFALMFGAYPLISRIGLKWSLQEATFVSFGGLRGAIAIALAVTLDSELRRDTAPGDPRRDQTTKMFGITGVIVLLSLVFNGTFAGPLLRWLRLVEPSDERKQIIEGHAVLLKKHLTSTMSRVTESNPGTFADVQLNTLREYVPILQNLTDAELLEYLPKTIENGSPTRKGRRYSAIARGFVTPSSHRNMLTSVIENDPVLADSSGDGHAITDEINEIPVLKEQRKVYISLLRSAYRKQIESGEVDIKRGRVAFKLLQSIDRAENAVAQGERLNDWEFLNTSSTSLISSIISKCCGDSHRYASLSVSANETDKVYRTIAFLRAHEEAESVYCESMDLDLDRSSMVEVYKSNGVLKESQLECEKAREFLAKIANLGVFATYALCDILLHSAANYALHLEKEGLMNEREAETMIDDVFTTQMLKLRKKESIICEQIVPDDDEA